MKIVSYTYKPQLKDSILKQEGLRFHKASDAIIQRLACDYGLPLDKNKIYIGYKGHYVALEYFENGIYEVDLCVEKTQRDAKKTVSIFKNIKKIFSILYYVNGYVAFIDKNNKGARVNAVRCGFVFWQEVENLRIYYSGRF